MLINMALRYKPYNSLVVHARNTGIGTRSSVYFTTWITKPAIKAIQSSSIAITTDRISRFKPQYKQVRVANNMSRYKPP